MCILCRIYRNRIVQFSLEYINSLAYMLCQSRWTELTILALNEWFIYLCKY